MAEEIVSKLGFDAGPAIQALQQLDTAMATLEGRLGSTAGSFTSFNKNAGKTVSALIQISKHGSAAANALAAVNNAQNASGGGNSAANAQAAASAASHLAASLNAAGTGAQSASVKIGNALARVGVQTGTAANQVQTGVTRMTVSLGLLNRIVFTQAIVRGLSQLRNAFQAAVGDAVKLQKQLALIQTIDDSGASFAALGDSVQNISNQFNIPQLEVASALYQTISNQIGDAAQSTEFLAEAAQFARATGSDLTASVDLLSGAIKSYNLGVEDAARVSSIFFKTVDLGRISANDLSNSFGRLGTIAADSGISIEELNAALASITVRGTKTSEALTQLRAITTSLLKPSVAMQKALATLGFSSGEVAIKTLGLTGTLKQLQESTRGSSSELAKLFPNVRALAGQASLASDGFESLTNNVSEMKNVADDFAKSKFLQATATDAEKVTKALNQIKNVLIDELGNAAVAFGSTFLDMVGGVENLSSAIKFADNFVLGLIGTLALLRTQSFLAASGVTALSAALGPLAAIPLAIGLGTAIAEQINEAMNEALNAEIKALEQANDAALKLYATRLKKERDEKQKHDAEILQTTREIFQELNKVYQEDVANARSANDAIVENAKKRLDDIVSTREKLVEELGKAQDAARDFQQDSRDRNRGSKERQGDRDFDKQFRDVRGLNNQIDALFGRASELSARAKKELAQGSLLGDPDKIASATRLFEKAQQVGEKALGLAGDNRFLQDEAFGDLEELTRKQIRAEEELQAVQNKRIKALAAERAEQQKIVDQIREQAKVALANTGVFDEQGKQFSPAEQAVRDEKRRQALKKVAESGLNSKDLNAAAALGLADFVSRFQSELGTDPIQLQFSVESEIARIQAQIKDSFAKFKVTAGVDVAGLEQGLGRELNSPDEIAQGLEDATTKAGELRQKIDEVLAKQKESAALKGELGTLVDLLGQRGLSDVAALGNDTLKADLETVSNLRSTVNELAEAGTITQEQLDALRQKLLAFVQALQERNGKVETTFFKGDVERLNQAFIKLTELKQLQAQSIADPALTAQLQTLESVLAKQPGAQFQTMSGSLTTGVPAAASIADSTQRAASAAERYAAAIQRALNAQRATKGKAFGGMSHLAAGGFGRGSDTIPAMLAPGEFVMNARSSRQFFSQLQAINGGQAPSFRENGGSVSNFGDVNVNVTGGDSSTQTIRDIGRGLRRELRRKTLDF